MVSLVPAGLVRVRGLYGWVARATAAVVPIITVVVLIGAIWYLACTTMNLRSALTQAERAGILVEPATAAERQNTGIIALLLRNPSHAWHTFDQERPRLPAPHQVVQELWKTTGAMVMRGKALSKRSLIHHTWVTLSATALGFLIGTAAGVALAVGIVHSRVMNLSVMPWAIASQTVPILAIAPMIIVVLNSVGVTGLLPKALISAYLSFFPVAVGMVAGLRSPATMQMDLMRTYNASATQVLLKLRVPASLPFFFASMKVGMAASLIGAIVGELPTGAVAGLGARLLSGSYYGQTIQIWSALLAAAFLAAMLVGCIGLIQRIVLRRMDTVG